MKSTVRMKDRIGYKLSPNEEARLLKEAREALRKKRLLQVREQAKLNAAKIRQSVKEEKQRQLQKLAKEIEDEWNKEKEEKLQTLNEIYEHSVKHVGEAHRNAVEEESKEDNRALIAEVDARRAKIRHENALQKLHEEVARQQEETNRHIVARQTALELEKARAVEIAKKPLPPPDPITKIDVPKVRPVKFTDLNAFSATHYHIPEVCYVEKAEPQEQEVDARQLAESESEKLAEIEKEQKRALHEQREKARLRHKHALKKELLKQDYAAMLHDLSDLQRADMIRRQHVVAKIPKQIFIPPHRRLEEKEEIQREMEGAFEDMYLKTTEYFGDLSLALDPHPPPETPSASESLDLSIQDVDATGISDQESVAEDPSRQSAVLTDLTNRGTPNQTESCYKTGDGYQRLLSRIKAQREMAQKGSPVTDEDLRDGSMSAVHPSPSQDEQTGLEEHRKTPEGLRRLVQRIKAQRESSQKASSVTAKGHRDRPSPASEATTLSQHPITETSPSSVTETESLSTGIMSSNGSSSLTQRTLTSRSSMSTASMTTQDTNESETLTESTSETPSEQDAYGSSESSTSTVIDVGKLADVDGSQLLLHPLEQAARVRQKVSQYLQSERQHQNRDLQQNKEMDHIRQETIQSQHRLEEQRRLLEEKMANIEKQRLSVISRMSELSTRKQDSTVSSQSIHSFYPPDGSTSLQASLPVRLFAGQPTPGFSSLGGSHPTATVDGFQTGSLPDGYSRYGMVAHPAPASHWDLSEYGVQSAVCYERDLPDKCSDPISELTASRQLMADRAQQFLRINSSIAKDVPYHDERPFQVSHPADADLSQVPMTGSSQNSSERQSMESGVAPTSPVRISGVSELHSTLPHVSDLEDRFAVLEERLHRAGAAFAPPAEIGSSAPARADPVGQESGGERNREVQEKDSFDKRRNELEAELDEIEKRKAAVLQQNQLQKEKIEQMKSQWFTMAPDSDEPPEQMSSAVSTQPNVDQGPRTRSRSPRRHLSFADSVTDSVSFSEDFRNLSLRAKSPEDRTGVDVSKKPLLHHPNEFNSRSTSHEASESARNDQFSWPVLQRSSTTSGDVTKAQNVPKSSRTWHMELLECSTSSENSSQKSAPKKLPTPPDVDKESLVFEVEGPRSPLVLRYDTRQVASTSDSQQFVPTPNQHPGTDAGLEAQAPKSCLSSQTPGSDLHQRLDRGMSVQFADKNRHTSEMLSGAESMRPLHTDISQYTISDESSQMSQQWASRTSELSQFAMSGHSDWMSRDSDCPGTRSEFTLLTPLSESSHLEQMALGESSRQEQNTRLHESNVERSSEMADDISRRIEESLAQHRHLIEQTARIMEQHQAETDSQSGADQEARTSPEQQQSTLSTLKDQTGILDEPDITLVSLDSNFDQQTEKDQDDKDDSSAFASVSVATTSCSMPADTTSMASTSLAWTTTPASTTQSPAHMSISFRDPSNSPQHQESMERSNQNISVEGLHGAELCQPSTSAAEHQGVLEYQCGAGARVKQVKFEVTDDTSESGRHKSSDQQQQHDEADIHKQTDEFISIHVQHMDGSSTDEYEGLSLREAFMKKKSDFIEASEKRKKKAAEKAKRSVAKSQQQQQQQQQQKQQQQQSSLGKTLASWKKSRKLNSQLAVKSRDPTTIVERTSEQRKKDEREMKARTSRLYNRLEEVKQRKLDEERKRQYAENRERAKAFYQKLEKQKKS